jgi:hypothetical protein
MLVEISLAAMAALLTPVSAKQSDAPPQVYVELIVKACPSTAPDVSADNPDAVHGYYTEPTNQGVSYDDVRPQTKEERESAFATMHCMDVPVPPEAISGPPLSRQVCMGHTGYLIAMQYLQQNPAYAKDFPDVGEWSCIEHPYPVQGAAGL